MWDPKITKNSIHYTKKTWKKLRLKKFRNIVIDNQILKRKSNWFENFFLLFFLQRNRFNVDACLPVRIAARTWVTASFATVMDAIVTTPPQLLCHQAHRPFCNQFFPFLSQSLLHSMLLKINLYHAIYFNACFSHSIFWISVVIPTKI